MNDTLKRLLVLTAAGALAGLGAASNVDRSEFKRWLQRENLGSIWQNIQEFKWDVAARRWWAGALGGAVTGFLGAIGVEQLGIDLGGLLQLGA
jgi:hypothetical protein